MVTFEMVHEGGAVYTMQKRCLLHAHAISVTSLMAFCIASLEFPGIFPGIVFAFVRPRHISAKKS